MALFSIRRLARIPFFLASDLLLRLKHGPETPRKYQLLFVRPQDVCLNHIGSVGLLLQSPDRFSGAVDGGDWDCLERLNPQCLEIRTVLEKRILEGLSWEDSGEIDRMLSLVDREGSFDHCKSLEDVTQRNRNLDKIIAFVRGTGTLLTRREMSAFAFREMDGIATVVARDGRLLLAYSGTHRLAIVQSLGAPVIPVAIALVHSECLTNGTWRTLLARSHSLEKEREALLESAARVGTTEEHQAKRSI
ncbi:hypothetical protein [Roseovarius sp. D0-M9]|uniref:hypothetical protein n=1 Tax=Roseovarius sp. D0-M9 TaxID=3127117 RepID=UPI00300FC56D